MKGMRLAYSSFIVSTGLGLASFFTVEALIPKTADAATIHLKCWMTGNSGKARQLKLTFNEARQKVTITTGNGTKLTFINPFITQNYIMVNHKVNEVTFDLKVNRITGKAIRKRRGFEIASGNCTKSINRKF